MQYRWKSCQHDLTCFERDQISSIAVQSFKGIPQSEISDRFEKYDWVLLAYDRKNIVGFLFLSTHTAANYYFIGLRLTAFLLGYQDRGAARRTIPYVFMKVYLPFFLRNLTSKDRQQMIVFCRLCTPFAYMPLSCGQEIFPDLIRHKSLELPYQAREIYTLLQRDLQLPKLDIRTGVIEGGAQNAGIVPPFRSLNKLVGWQTPWDEYVSSGSELLVTFKVNSMSLLFLAKGLVKSTIRNTWRSLSRVFRYTLLLPSLILWSLICSLIISYHLLSKNVKRGREVVRTWASFSLFLLEIKLRIHGRENLDLNKKFIAACSHTSLLDTFIYPAILPSETLYIAKIELKKLPLLSWVYRRLGYFFIDRQRPHSSFRLLREYLKRSDENSTIFVHPEGTRNQRGGILPLKSAIFILANETRKPIVPCVSVGGPEIWPLKALLPRRGIVDVYVGEAIDTHAWQVRDKKLNLEELRKRMQKLLDEALTKKNG